MNLSTDTSRLRHLLLMALGQEELGLRIKEARESASLTQQEMADRIGIRQGQTVSNYERGVTEVSTKRLRRIAETTGKPITFFVQEPPGEPAAVEGAAALAEIHTHLEDIAATVAGLARGQAAILEVLQGEARAEPEPQPVRPRRKAAS